MQSCDADKALIVPERLLSVQQTGRDARTLLLSERLRFVLSERLSFVEKAAWKTLWQNPS